MELAVIQKRVYEWKRLNFPNSGDLHQFLGVVEEVGELAHAILKMQQGIRGDLHEAEARDAVGDIIIFLMNFCSENNWLLDDIILETWDEVSKRNWNEYPKDGRSE
jgi:NTP pyrophosphatase (non-canonical NTP hydrolase)